MVVRQYFSCRREKVVVLEVAGLTRQKRNADKKNSNKQNRRGIRTEVEGEKSATGFPLAYRSLTNVERQFEKDLPLERTDDKLEPRAAVERLSATQVAALRGYMNTLHSLLGFGSLLWGNMPDPDEADHRPRRLHLLNLPDLVCP
jgi:hypothetical protein